MAARDTINQLKAGGMSYSEIARKLGRDSSLISQIARGKKQGKNLEGALDDIKEKRSVREPERRKTKGGETAKVRKAKPTAARPAKLIKDKRGRIIFAPPTEKPSVTEKRLSRIATDGGRVSFRVTFEDGTEKLIFKIGIYAQQAIREIYKSGLGIHAWLEEQAATNQGYNQEDLGAIIAVAINATYTT